MDLERVDATDLGFGTGWTSGVAWQGSSGRKSSGRVTEARFERNHFGAYTFEAEGMHWSNNVFANNLGYGFDPHDFSSHFVVTGNAAFGNGHHGIIFSRGCRGNVLRNNRCYDNRGHGIMLDDGKVTDDGDPRHVRAVPSDDNVVEDNQAWNNDVGIALEGGTGNAVRANDVHDNDYGIRLQDRAHANEVARNTIRGSRMFAIYIYDHSDRNRIVDNQIDGGRGAIIVKESVGNLIKGNIIRGIVGRGIGLEGVVTDSKIDHNLIAGRGSRAIDPVPGPGPATEAPAGNRTWRWMQTGGFVPAGLIWVTVLCVPLIMSIRGRWKGPFR
jgi:parallel beta-helix repeat protein